MLKKLLENYEKQRIMSSPSRMWRGDLIRDKVHVSVLSDVDETKEELVVRLAKEINKYIKLGWKVEEIETNPYQCLDKTHSVTIVFEWDED